MTSTEPPNRYTVARRAHRKSRNGCRRCKQRRIKCDEVHPRCGNCTKHDVECDFTPPASRPTSVQPAKRAIPRLNQSSPSSSESSASSPSPMQLPLAPSYQSSTLPFRESDRMLELRLFHHFSRLCVERAPRHKPMRNLWSDTITSLAFSAPFLMDGVLALSALHLRMLNPADTSLIRPCHQYMVRALNGYVSTMSNGIDPSNAEAMYVMSMLVAFHSSVGRHFLHGASARPSSIPLHYFQPFSGIRTVFRTAFPGLKDSILIQIFPGCSSNSGCQHLEHECPFSFLLDGLAEEGKDAATKHAYRFTVAYICSVLHSPMRRDLFRFLVEAPSRYIDLIRAEDPRALVITGCWFAIAKTIDLLWWLNPTSEAELRGIRAHVSARWRDMLDRATQMIWAFVEERKKAPLWYRWADVDHDGQLLARIRSNGDTPPPPESLPVSLAQWLYP